MGRYLVEELLGKSGMADVFRARAEDAPPGTPPVALKRMSPALSEDARFAEMFLAELRVAKLLSHPNIVTVFDFDRDEQGFYVAMELVDGIDLGGIGERLRARGERLAPGLAAWVVTEVLKGLAFAHDFKEDWVKLHIVHRDVTPENVLVSREGAVKLADFGVARVAAAASVISGGAKRKVLPYTAPEQARGEAVDARTDVYAVGIILDELLAGPTDATPRPPLAERRPDLPADLAAVVARMTADAPFERYASAQAAIDGLRGCGLGFQAGGAKEIAAIVGAVLVAPAAGAPALAADDPPTEPGGAAEMFADARVEVLVGPAYGRVFQLPPGREIVIGRIEACDLAIPDPDLSRKHARVRRDLEGTTIADLGSKNGTSVNEEPLPSGGSRVLHDGDLIQLGVTILAYRETRR